MAYERHTWECGEEITADKLNHMESGIELAGGGSITVFEITDDPNCENGLVADTTLNDVAEAMQKGVVAFNYINQSTHIFTCYIVCGITTIPMPTVIAASGSEEIRLGRNSDGKLSTCAGSPA